MLPSLFRDGVTLASRPGLKMQYQYSLYSASLCIHPSTHLKLTMVARVPGSISAAGKSDSSPSGATRPANSTLSPQESTWVYDFYLYHHYTMQNYTEAQTH